MYSYRQGGVISHCIGETDSMLPLLEATRSKVILVLDPENAYYYISVS